MAADTLADSTYSKVGDAHVLSLVHQVFRVPALRFTTYCLHYGTFRPRVRAVEIVAHCITANIYCKFVFRKPCIELELQ